VRGLGCRDDEIVRLGAYAVPWRGAVFRADPTGEQEGSLVTIGGSATPGASQ